MCLCVGRRQGGKEEGSEGVREGRREGGGENQREFDQAGELHFHCEMAPTGHHPALAISP